MTTALQKKLSRLESEQLRQCEKIISRGSKSFVEVAEALATVRDRRLYRAEHETFEAYCRTRWDFGAKHAHNILGASEVVAGLIQDSNSVNQESARADICLTAKKTSPAALVRLKAVKPKQRAKVMAEAVKLADGHAPTRAQIQTAIERRHSGKAMRSITMNTLASAYSPNGADAEPKPDPKPATVRCPHCGKEFTP